MAQPERLPRIEAAVYRDPDSGTEVVVFLDGKRLPTEAVLVGVVDPGKGYPHPLSEWRHKIFAAAGAGGSAEWLTQMAKFYSQAEGTYTIDNTIPARDAQPGVTRMAELDPAVWVGDGLTGDAAGDNTVRAGWALSAVVSCWTASARTDNLNTLAEAGRSAFERVADDDGDDLDVTVQDILNSLRHLADARDLSLDLPLDERDGELRMAIDLLVRALRHALEDSWSEVVERDWDDIEQCAESRYAEDLTGAGEF